jgi:hypothetical protein
MSRGAQKNNRGVAFTGAAERHTERADHIQGEDIALGGPIYGDGGDRAFAAGLYGACHSRTP